MDFSALLVSLQNQLGTHLPMVLGAVGILILGWVVALILRAGVRQGGRMLRLNARLSALLNQSLDVEHWLGVGAFWLAMVVTLAAVFNSLNLEVVSAPFAQLVAQVMGFLPNLISGGILLLLAWVLATAARAILNKVLSKTSLDEKLSTHAGMQPLGNSIGNVLFWLIIVMFTPMILGALNLRGLLGPVENMLNAALLMLPNVFGAAVIGLIGYLVAKVLRGLVSNLVAASGIDRFGGQVSLSSLAGTLVFVFVFVPALISALDALKIQAISRPATEMLARFMSAIPDIFAAALILSLTYAVSKFVAAFLARLLSTLRFDDLPSHFGFAGGLTGAMAPSVIAGRLVIFYAMLFATVEAANRLGFTQVRDVVTMFIKFGGQVLLGCVILLVGSWLANLAARTIRAAGGDGAETSAAVARFAIFGLVIAMGLRAMGIANDIVNLAFGLTLGAIAGAVALSFGLGGREAAGRQMEYWLSKLRK